jgi:arylsulfatase A-like enzyme
VLDFPRSEIVEVAVFAGCLAAAIGWSALRRRRPRPLPSEAAVALMVLGAVTIAVSAEDFYRAARPATLPAGGEQRAPARPSILLVVLDTVGANRLSIYGHSRPTTPELQRFLDVNDRAVLYPLAFSTAPWTAPSHASLFTGRLASDLGLQFTRFSWPRLPEPTLSGSLRDQGYRTAAVVANPMLTHWSDILDGFELVVRWRPLHLLRLTPGEALRARLMPRLADRATKPTPVAEIVNRAVLDLVAQCGDDPCFVFANYMDGHVPYTPASPFAGMWSDGVRAGERGADDRRGAELELSAARHDEAIAGLDRALGELLDQLASSDVLDRWWIVITSDHGEAFGEHGYTQHGKGLHVEQTKVPLLIAPPRGDRLTARHDAVSLIDVATTIAALGGIDRFGDGEDLRAPAATARPARMEAAERKGSRDGPVPFSRAVAVGRRHFIEWPDRGELYDLEADRAQRQNLVAAAPDEVDRLRLLLPRGLVGDAAPAGGATTPLEEVDDAARRELRALGYLD